MPAKKLTLAMRTEYTGLYSTAILAAAKGNEINTIINRIVANRSRYELVANTTGVPWYFIAIIHNMEVSGKFNGHLHNGDPLTARTVQVPANRPRTGVPPFTWEESALDALAYEGFVGVKGWSISQMLFRLEKYNGFGYRPKQVNSPYLWSYSQHFTKGKYVADGVWDPAATSRQAGAAVILKQLQSTPSANITIETEPEQKFRKFWQVPHNTKAVNPDAIELQLFLNQYGYNLNPDGKAGNLTSDALFEFSGKRLVGDTR
jgi:lysozyme family protein